VTSYGRLGSFGAMGCRAGRGLLAVLGQQAVGITHIPKRPARPDRLSTGSRVTLRVLRVRWRLGGCEGRLLDLLQTSVHHITLFASKIMVV
jgi:hypothetical protein